MALGKCTIGEKVHLLAFFNPDLVYISNYQILRHAASVQHVFGVTFHSPSTSSLLKNVFMHVCAVIMHPTVTYAKNNNNNTKKARFAANGMNN